PALTRLTGGPEGNAVSMTNLRRAIAALAVAGVLAGTGACSASADKDDGGVKIEGRVGDEKNAGY
ncbi:MAG: hypothetical protein ACRD0O_07835, partial [Acidimicrobiia bacterium]